MIIPSPTFAVCALNALQKSMMLTPCWPSAGPTGGAGVAAPAWICSLIRPAIFFFGGMFFRLLSDVRGRGRCGESDLADRQILETLENSISTGVSRPKIE